MASQKVVVPVMEKKDYRDPKEFASLDDSWSDFLARWNNPDITRDEAKGLLHVVADRLWWAREYPARQGEDSRETCVRFLLYYASYPYRFDSEWQIVEKARRTLILKVLDTTYVEDEAPVELVEDVLSHIVEQLKKREGDYLSGHYRKRIEDFLGVLVRKRRFQKISTLVSSTVNLLFRSKHTYREFGRR